MVDALLGTHMEKSSTEADALIDMLHPLHA
jgi:hypothetical protein